MGNSGPVSELRHRRLDTPRPFVIVVDGDPAVRHSLRFLLEIEGYAVTALSNPTAVLEHSSVHLAVCLIIDHDLPGMNGLDLMKVLRSRYPEIPLILMASNVDKQILSRSRAFGVQVVEKPIFGDILNQAIITATQ